VAGINGIGTGPYSTASTAVTPTAGDPFFSSVALLLPMDGTGSTFIDSSGAPKTITAVGATQSATHSKWGGKSAYFSSSGDYLSFSDVGIGTGDFAIEMWFKTNSSVQYAQLIGNETSGSASGFSLLINNDSSTGGQIALYRGGLILSSSSGDFSDDQWHYLALSRSGTTVRLYIDGAIASTATSSANLTSSASMFIGYNNAFPPRNVVGYIDDLRITVGSARGLTGATVTVPVSAFPILGPPGSPTSLAATAGNAQIALAWTAPSSNGGSAITGYTVEYTPSGGSAQTVSTGSTSTSYTLTGLTNGTAYTVRVAGVNVAGTGTYSGTATSTPSAANPVTVSPATIQGRYGGAPYTWSGTGTSSNKLTTGGAVRSNNFALSVVRNVTFTCNASGTLFFESNRIDDGEGGLYYQTFLSYRKNGGAESTAWATAQTDVGDVWRRGVSVTAGDTIILQNVGTNMDGVEAIFSVWIE
jgi:hypothetical protein